MSKKVFQTHLGDVPLDMTALNKVLEERVNGPVWNPGDVLLVDTIVPEGSAESMRAWLATFGIRKADFVDAGTLNACEGSTFHEDSQAYGNEFFCIQWLEHTDPWDLVFPESGIRIPLSRGSTVLFDPANVHGVVGRGCSQFDEPSLGDYGVQAFSSLNLKSNPKLMRLFDVAWLKDSHDTLDLTWNEPPRRVCHLTGAAVSC
ncbi:MULTISPECIES: hypothetical protein [unclassified Variovorax]|uniref:hypothetical protein n=1 Tax=unclassified Variovorax TaxID=663243 RepID=UPI0011AED335|nr:MULTISPECIES: hypothetical protein [unclassified Variovorax]